MDVRMLGGRMHACLLHCVSSCGPHNCNNKGRIMVMVTTYVLAPYSTAGSVENYACF
jgi:hypothetical protein